MGMGYTDLVYSWFSLLRRLNNWSRLSQERDSGSSKKLPRVLYFTSVVAVHDGMYTCPKYFSIQDYFTL